MRKFLLSAVVTAFSVPLSVVAFDVFAPPEPLRPEFIFPTKLALGDINGDGMLDIAMAMSSQNVFLLNKGNGQFRAANNITEDSHDTRAITLADIDGENGLDVIAGNTSAGGVGIEINRYYLNTGSSPWFMAGSDLGTEVDRTIALAVGDLDGTNGQDVVTVNTSGFQGAPNSAYLSTGAGYAASMNVRTGAGPDAVLVDLDGDGRDDYLEIEGSIFAIRNDGNGQLISAFGDGFFPSSQTGSSIAAGDLDGDGDPDVVVGEFEAASRSLVHLLSGESFSAGMSLNNPLDVNARDVALADLNGDGHLDIVETNQNGPDAVYINNGRARFDRAANIADTPTFSAIALGDVDNDGDVDLVANNKLYRNVSSTHFVALGDVNDNSSPDFAALRRDTGTGKNVVDVMDSASNDAIYSINVGQEPIRGLGVINGNNGPELVVLTEGSVRARLRDGATGANIATIKFSNNLVPRQLLTLPNIDGNGGDEIAVFGTNPKNGLVWTQIKDAQDKVEVSRVKFGKTLRYLHALLLDDLNGNSAPEIAFVGVNRGHRVVVTVKDSLTGDKITSFKATAASEFPLGYAAAPDANGRLSYVAILTRSAAGKHRAFVRDAAADGALIARVGFSTKLEPLGILVMGDTDGDTSAGQVSPEIAMLGRNANGGIRLQMKDLATGMQIGPQLKFASSYQPVRLLELGEAGQGPALDVALLGINGNGVYRAEIMDPISMDRVAAIRLP